MVLLIPTRDVHTVEPAGKAHWNYVLSCLGLASAADGKASKKGPEDTPIKKVVLTPETYVGLNHYELLGLDPLGISVDDEKIKRAYHKALLTYHPDKTGRGDEDEVFLAIQEAHATLSDFTKRRAYDSQNEFDDSIPSGNEKGNFYEIYGPVFHSNGRFAEVLPVPQLGDENTDIEDVYAFYDYWEKFESWRDFTRAVEREHDPDSADSREEKRWMIKENERGVKALKKKEYQRITTLVDRARSKDPRIKAAARAEKEAKQRAKEAKAAEAERIKQEKREAEEAAKAKAEEEARIQREANKDAKLEREKAKKALRKKKKALEKLLTAAMEANPPSEMRLMPSQIAMLVDELEPDQLTHAAQIMGGEVESVDLGGLPAIHDMLDTIKARLEGVSLAEVKAKAEKAKAKAKAEAEAKAKREEETRWSPEELSMLAKAARKFPAGSQNRWQIIADYINQQLSLPVERTKEEVLKKYQQVQAAPAQVAANMSSGGSAAAESVSTGGGAATPASPAAPAAPAASSGGPKPDEWTQEQQKQLETALAKFPAGDFAEPGLRWKVIAQNVEGKNKKQCVERFKALRAALKNKK